MTPESKEQEPWYEKMLKDAHLLHLSEGMSIWIKKSELLEFLPTIIAHATKLGRAEMLEEVKKVVEESRIVSAEDKNGNHLPYYTETASITAILNRLDSIKES